MKTKVLKFGGAALETTAHFENVASIIESQRKDCQNLIVVVSAMGGMTDYLLNLAKEVHPKPPAREQDMLISVGERISMSLLAMALEKRGISSISLTGSQSGVITSDSHGKATIIDVRPERIKKHLSEGLVVIVAGFQGVSIKKEITTLGRGGSDTTAVALGAAFSAEEVIFYKDVEGVYTNDPKKYPEAKQIERLSYIEALVLCRNGGVVHPGAIEYAKKHTLLLKIKAFNTRSKLFTLIYK